MKETNPLLNPPFDRPGCTVVPNLKRIGRLARLYDKRGDAHEELFAVQQEIDVLLVKILLEAKGGAK